MANIYVTARSNERAKLIAAMIGNLATGLTGYTGYRMFIEGRPDILAFGGIVGVSVLVFCALATLDLIQPELSP